MRQEGRCSSIIPVFIGGCQRSGTTLLGAMLGAHDECLTTPESLFVIEVLASCETEKGKFDVRKAFSLIKNHWRFKIWQLDISAASYPVGESSYSELIACIVKQYGIKVGKDAARFWIDHTPRNTQYGAALFELFPQAKMIHIVRDGRAVAASIMPLSWGPNVIDKAARFWLERLAYGLAAESFWGEERVTRVRYEDLVLEPETTLRRLCSFLGIEYQPEMIMGSGFKIPDYTLEQHVLIGGRPNPERVSAWERELTARQIEIFESIAGPMLWYLDYTPRYGLKSRGMTVLERILAGIYELYMAEIVNRFRQRQRIRRVIRAALNI